MKSRPPPSISGLAATAARTCRQTKLRVLPIPLVSSCCPPFLLSSQVIPNTQPSKYIPPIWTRQKTTYSPPNSLESKLKVVLDSKYIPRNPLRKKTTNIAVDGDYVALDNVFLRDACRCPSCVDPSTQQKLFQTSDIPRDVRASKTQSNPDSTIDITWVADSTDYLHQSTYTLNDIRLFTNLRLRIRSRYNDQAYILWERDTMQQEVQFINYEEYMKNDEVLLFALIQLARFGLVFLKNVPPNDPNAVEGIAERIGPIKSTFYGKTWDVKSVQNSKNIAYTSLDLGLHMDLLYFASPPGLQFLHCIKNSVRGGSSYFADSFRAAEWVRLNSPINFQALLSFPVTFHYKNDGHHYHYIHPTVVLEPYLYQQRKRISHVNFSPPFQAPFEIDNGFPPPNASFRQFFAGIGLIAKLVGDPANQFELRLNPGECVIFQNRRVLHARREFDATSGDRWLKGTYVDTDAFMSKFRVLSSQYVRWKNEPDDDFQYIR